MRASRSRAAAPFRLIDVDNPPFRANQLFVAQENLHDPRCQELRERYGLDAVVAEESDEFQRILLLRQWLDDTIEVDSLHPTPVREEAFHILDSALRGGRFFCTHFSLVQPAVLSSFGYVSRRLGVGPGPKEAEGGWHHGVNEVWVNSLCKWVLTDAKYNVHYEKAGLPLSALEVREELLRDNGAQVRASYGAAREERDPHFFEGIDAYRWISWWLDPTFTGFPCAHSSLCVVYDDAYYREHTWYRGGRPHWAYGAGSFLPVRDRHWIEWTPNVIASQVTLAERRARIELESCTPNLDTYQMKRGRGAWRPCPDRLDLKLPANGIELTFRTANLAGVTGPEHRVVIAPAG